MKLVPGLLGTLVVSLWLLLAGLHSAIAEAFKVATFNLENYIEQPTQTRAAKTPAARAKVRESIRAMAPDVLALQEVGSVSALLELRESLKAEGLEFPYWEHVAGFDTNVQVAILSRFPFTERRSCTNEAFLLRGRRFKVTRGFGELDIQVNPHYRFTLLTAHLKSRRALEIADESELRLEEAKLLRKRIDACFAANPGANLIVLGDFNDTQDRPSIKALVGRGAHKLVDTRPAEHTGSEAPRPTPGSPARPITWTHYYAKEDTYARIDYLLLSPGMAREWIPGESYVLASPDWGQASDHRPVVATFEAKDR